MDAIALARKALTARMAEPKAKVFGVSDDLRVIRDAFEEFERRIAVLAAVVLRMHYRQTITSAQWDALAGMGSEPAIVHRLANHGDDCTCQECMQRAVAMLDKITATLRGS